MERGGEQGGGEVRQRRDREVENGWARGGIWGFRVRVRRLLDYIVDLKFRPRARRCPNSSSLHLLTLEWLQVGPVFFDPTVHITLCVNLAVDVTFI